MFVASQIRKALRFGDFFLQFLETFPIGLLRLRIKEYTVLSGHFRLAIYRFEHCRDRNRFPRMGQ